MVLTAAAPARTAGHRAGIVLTGALAASAWALLWAWDASAWGRYLDHSGLVESTPGGPLAVGVFVGGWALMLVAMMLPTTQPLVSLFIRVVARRPDRRRLLAMLLGGYLTVWLLAGLVAYGADLALHAAEDSLGVVGDDEWLLAAGVLAVAGAYQLSSLKDRCLQACRSPRLYVVAHWHGRHAVAESFVLGAAHGRTCVGCCWALMLVLFAVGAGSLGWMLALAAVMAAEKTLPGGAALRVPLGLGLLVAAAMVALAR
jgi:predicted metal-binding membrane protein